RRNRGDAKDGCAARRAEVTLRLAAVILADSVERSQRVAFNRERVARNADDHREGAARLTLAVGAMTRTLNNGLGLGLIPHPPTQTAASDRTAFRSHVQDTTPYTGLVTAAPVHAFVPARPRIRCGRSAPPIATGPP